MPADIIMPRLGLTMEEGTVVRWLAAEGEHVVQGAPLLEVETDKVVVEVEAPAFGVLRAIRVRAGEKAPVGALLAHLYDAEEVGARKKEEGKRRISSSPRARWRADRLGLDWRTLAGSGPRGRIVERDVLAAAGTKGKRKASFESKEEGKPDLPPALHHLPSAAPPPPEGLAPPPSLFLPPSATPGGAAPVPPPSLHLDVEVMAEALLKMCARLSPAIEKRAGVQLTTTDLLIRICGAALARIPHANARWEDGRVSLLSEVNVALAAGASQAGPLFLLPCFLPNRPLSQIAAERAALLERAAAPHHLPSSFFLPPGAAAFTLLDLGRLRVDRLRAVLDPDQSAILTVGRIAERPVVIDGRLAVRPTVFLTLSCDSRVFDAALAAKFLDCIVDLIEEPYGLLI